MGRPLLTILVEYGAADLSRWEDGKQGGNRAHPESSKSSLLSTPSSSLPQSSHSDLNIRFHHYKRCLSMGRNFPEAARLFSRLAPL